MERAWWTLTALGGLWAALCLSGCGVLIGIEPIEVTGGTGGAGEGSEAIYQITAPPSVKTLQFALDPNTTLFDSVLYVRSVCADLGTQILCQDIQGAASDSGEKLKLNNTGAPLYVFVDTRSPQAPSYAYTLVVTPGT